MYRITKDIIDKGKMNGRYFGVRKFHITKDVYKVLGAGEIDSASEITAFDAKPKVKFRLLDDDKHPYFEGEMLANTEGEDEAFEPLDSFGAAYGCTIMQLWEGGKWVAL